MLSVESLNPLDFAIRQYEIRFLRGDGVTTILWMASCCNDQAARAVAGAMVPADTNAVEIWRDDICVNAFSALTGRAIAMSAGGGRSECRQDMR